MFITVRCVDSPEQEQLAGLRMYVTLARPDLAMIQSYTCTMCLQAAPAAHMASRDHALYPQGGPRGPACIAHCMRRAAHAAACACVLGLGTGTIFTRVYSPYVFKPPQPAGPCWNDPWPMEPATIPICIGLRLLSIHETPHERAVSTVPRLHE
jgi:hypothetical protein